MVDNGPISASYAANAARLGRDVADPEPIADAVVGSTDMGNVSYLVPSIHPMIQVVAAAASRSTRRSSPTTPAVAEGDQAVSTAPRRMAMTIVDLWCQPDAREAAAASASPTGRADVDVLATCRSPVARVARGRRRRPSRVGSRS